MCELKSLSCLCKSGEYYAMVCHSLNTIFSDFFEPRVVLGFCLFVLVF